MKKIMEELARNFLRKTGIFTGTFKHIKPEEKDTLIIQRLSDEAIKTSKTEGEYLDRTRVQESIKKYLGLESSKKNLPVNH